MHQTSSMTQWTLDRLVVACQLSMRQYRLGYDGAEANLAGLEIVKRAASGDTAAVAALIALCDPLVAQRCPPELSDRLDEVEREVAHRLEGRFLRSPKPFEATHFAAFICFVQRIIHSASIAVGRRWWPQSPLETESGWEASAPSQTEGALEEEEARRQAESLLAALPDPLEREVLHRRYRRGESVPTICRALADRTPGLTTQRTYHLLEQARRHARHIPLDETTRYPS